MSHFNIFNLFDQDAAEEKLFADLETAFRPHLTRLVMDRPFAVDLYRSLCNIRWIHESFPQDDRQAFAATTWRVAGAFVADLRGLGEDYLDYYCSGAEGHVHPDVAAEMAKLGWTWGEWDSSYLIRNPK